MTLSAITWAAELDTDRDGDFDFSLNPYINAASQITIDRGMNDQGIYQVSQVSLSLNNDSGIFTPENPAGALYGLLRPDTPAHITATHNATDYTLWTGYAQRWTAERFRIGEGRARLECWDLAAYLKNITGINVLLSTSRDTDAALTAIMTAAGLDSGDADFDDGQQDLPYHWARNQDALTALMEAARSEMGGLLWVNAAGQLRFEARNSRLGTSADDTWGDGTNVQPEDVQYELVDDDTITSASVQASIYATGLADTEVLRFSRGKDTRPTADSIAIAAGGRYGPVDVDYAGFVALAAITTPAAVTDYLGNTAANGSGTDKTSALTVTVTDLGAGARIQIDNTDAGTVYVTKFRLRGQPAGIPIENPNYVFTKSIPGVKALRGIEVKLPWVADTAKARDLAYALLRTYRMPYPRVTLSFPWDNDDTVAAMLGVEIGWLVAFADSDGLPYTSGVDDWWYVERIQHTIRPDGAGDVNRSTIMLLPSYLYRDLDHIAFDLFTRANGSGDLGTSTSDDTWADDSGFDLNTSAARPNSTSAAVPSIDLGVADMVVAASLSNLSGDTDEECGVCFRKQDTSNYWRFYVDDGSDEAVLEKVISGTPTVVAHPAWTPTDTAEVEVRAQGNRIRCYVDGTLVADATDSALNDKTKAGLFSRSTTAVFFDDWYGQGV